MKTPDDKSWAGEYWGWGGSLRGELAEPRARLRANPYDWEAMSGMSSAYHSAGGNALGRMRDAWAPLKLFWGIVGLWCAERALAWSNRLWDNIPKSQLTADMCDIRQSICRKVAQHIPWRRKYLVNAWWAIVEGLDLLSEGAPHASHTLPLLLTGKADVMLRNGEDYQEVKKVMGEIRRLADDVVAYLSPDFIQEMRQFTRVYRHLKDLYRRIGNDADADACQRIMEQLAEESGAGDQVLKARAE